MGLHPNIIYPSSTVPMLLDNVSWFHTFLGSSEQDLFNVFFYHFFYPFIYQLVHAHIDNMDILTNTKATADDIAFSPLPQLHAYIYLVLWH